MVPQVVTGGEGALEHSTSASSRHACRGGRGEQVAFLTLRQAGRDAGLERRQEATAGMQAQQVRGTGLHALVALRFQQGHEEGGVLLPLRRAAQRRGSREGMEGGGWHGLGQGQRGRHGACPGLNCPQYCFVRCSCAIPW